MRAACGVVDWQFWQSDWKVTDVS